MKENADAAQFSRDYAAVHHDANTRNDWIESVGQIVRIDDGEHRAIRGQIVSFTAYNARRT